MARYRYVATATAEGDQWTIKVEGVPGTATTTNQKEVEDAARALAANHLVHVPIENIDVLVNYWRVRENVPWQETCDFSGQTEHTVLRRVFHGGSLIECLDGLRNWLLDYDDRDHLIVPLTLTFRRYYGVEIDDGHAPHELDVTYEKDDDPLPNSLTLASTVIAVLKQRGITAYLAEDSTADRATIIVDQAEYRFVVCQQDDSEAWHTESVLDGDIDSTLDGLGVTTPADTVADAIQRHLAGETEVTE